MGSNKEAIELAWGLIANAYGGDWGQAPEGWSAAAERWRDRFADAALSSDQEQRFDPDGSDDITLCPCGCGKPRSETRPITRTEVRVTVESTGDVDEDLVAILREILKHHGEGPGAAARAMERVASETLGGVPGHDHIHLIDDPVGGLTIVDTGEDLKVCYQANQHRPPTSGFGVELHDLDGLIPWLVEKQARYQTRGN